MKRVSFPHFLVWVALLAAAFPALVANGQSEKLRVAISSISTSQVNVWVPLDTGFFKKQGLDVELVYISGAPVGAAALMSGEVAISHTNSRNQALGGPSCLLKYVTLLCTRTSTPSSIISIKPYSVQHAPHDQRNARRDRQAEHRSWPHQRRRHRPGDPVALRGYAVRHGSFWLRGQRHQGIRAAHGTTLSQKHDRPGA